MAVTHLSQYTTREAFEAELQVGANASAGRNQTTYNVYFHYTAPVLSQFGPAQWLVRIASLISMLASFCLFLLLVP